MYEILINTPMKRAIETESKQRKMSKNNKIQKSKNSNVEKVKVIFGLIVQRSLILISFPDALMKTRKNLKRKAIFSMLVILL